MATRLLVFATMVLATNLHAEEAPSAREEQRIFLSSIPVTIEEGAFEKENPQILIRFSNYKGSDYAEISTRNKNVVAKDETLKITGLMYPDSADKVKRQYKTPSFFVDYDEPAFAGIIETIKTKFGPKPTAEQLSEFVSHFIENKNYTRGFDVASKVVVTKEGDCSEHAVLLVALMRHFKIPARLVFGIVILRGSSATIGGGHAWVEYNIKKRWHVADAALQMNPEKKATDLLVVSYIPIRVPNNETAGFLSEMLSGFSVLHVRGVAIQ